MRALFLLFIIMPIIEILILIEVGSLIGGWYTAGLVLLTAVIGVNLLKQQGLRTLMNAQQKAQQGALPISEIGEGMLLAIAGALLLTPGFVTDGIGFALLIPGVRSQLAVQVANQLITKGSGFSSSTYENYSDGHYSRTETHAWQDQQGNSVIDAEYEEIDENSADEIKRIKK